MPWPFLYFASFVFSCALAALLTVAARAAGLRLGVLDRPGGRKDHAKPIPVTGGWAIFGAFILIAAGGGWLGPTIAGSLPESWEPLPRYLKNLEGMRGELAAIMIGLAWIFTIGAIDDVRPLGPRFKLIAQILSVVPLLYRGISIHVFLPSPALGWVVTVLWAVILMNSFNFLDNMDGLCATVGAAVAIVLAVAAYQGGQLWLPALYLCFAGVLAGFLIFNFHPATIFMGDAGSLVIGYLLATFSTLTTYYESGAPSGLPVLIPIAVMGVPLFDTISVFWIRWRSGASLVVADHNHFSHRLRALGFSVRQTAVTVGILTAAIGLASLPLRYLKWSGALLHLLAIAMLFCVVGALEFIGRQKSENAKGASGAKGAQTK